MQKLINVLALASTAVSVAVVGSGLYVYVNRGSIIDGVKSQIMESVTGGLGGLGKSLPEISPPAGAPSGLGLPAPNSPF